jgi:hypothetical protein
VGTLARTDRQGVDLLHAYAAANNLRISDRRLDLTDRTVVWIQARWDDLQVLPFTAIPIAEIRRPEFVDTIEDLSRGDQDELTADLVERSTVAAADVAPIVCHLDSSRHLRTIVMAPRGSQPAQLKDHPTHCTRNTSTRCSSSSTR